MSAIRSGILAALVAAPVAVAAAQGSWQTSTFRWSERIEAGRTMRATNINGGVTVREASGDRVELTAVKRWRRGNPESVRVHAESEGGNIRICPLYEDQDDCDDDNSRSKRWRDSEDVTIELTILVPRGVHVMSGSVNGPVSITGMTGDVEAASVNGDVRVEAGRGRLTATTVQGTVHAIITTRPSSMDFTTVNGDVIAEIASSIGARVEMTTVNGSLRSDFEMPVRGRFDPRQVTTHIGPPGGPTMRLTTVNGSVQLRKR